MIGQNTGQVQLTSIPYKYIGIAIKQLGRNSFYRATWWVYDKITGFIRLDLCHKSIYLRKDEIYKLDLKSRSCFFLIICIYFVNIHFFLFRKQMRIKKGKQIGSWMLLLFISFVLSSYLVFKKLVLPHTLTVDGNIRSVIMEAHCASYCVVMGSLFGCMCHL